MSEPSTPSVEDVLHAAVGNLGGEDRPGQVQMAQAVREAMRRHEHLLVQAGTGTGKSLGYLVPAVLNDERVVVATATLALQHQLVQRDIPALLDAASEVLGERPEYAVLKGRSNYACLHRIRDGVPDDQGTLVDLPEGSLGSEVVRLREWAEQESKAGGLGDRDSAPSHTDKIWQQVSVNHRECLGANKCAYAVECFAERAREHAMQSKLIVTNHSLLAIDAVEGVPMIPEYDVVVVDEAHELSSRVTQAATDELSIPAIERAARRARNFLDGSEADDMSDAGDALRAAMDDLTPGRIDDLPDELADALALLRSSAAAAFSGFPKESAVSEADAARQQARGMVDEIRKIAERLAAHAEHDVSWLAERDARRGGNQLCVAPLQVWGQLRDRLLSEKTVVFTSATLKLGGDFTALASSIGLKPTERVDHSIDDPADTSAEAAVAIDADESEPKRVSGRRGRAAVARHRRRLAVRLPAAGDPLRRQAPAAARSRRAGHCPDRGDRRPARGRRRSHAGAVLEPPRCGGRLRGAARAAPAHADPLPGRRPAVAPPGGVRRQPGRQPVRHALAVAGPRRAR